MRVQVRIGVTPLVRVRVRLRVRSRVRIRVRVTFREEVLDKFPRTMLKLGPIIL